MGDVQREADVNVSVSTSALPSVSAGSAVLQTCERAVGPGVHTATDQAYDSEFLAYFRKDSPPPPTPFYYGPSPLHATTPFVGVSLRAASRQSA